MPSSTDFFAALVDIPSSRSSTALPSASWSQMIIRGRGSFFRFIPSLILGAISSTVVFVEYSSLYR
jgi:hypothetical protein